MSGGSTTEVVVIGAGINGASLAWHLANRGIRVTVVERDFPASGPTGRSSAIVHAFYLEPELSLLAYRGTETLRNLRELTGGDAGFKAIGMLWVVGPEGAPEWRQAVTRIRKEGAEIETLTVEQFATLAPGFTTDGIALAVWEPTCGYADPAAATNALIRGARDRGAQVRTGTPTARIITQGGRAVGIETVAGERIGAGAVVVAAGPWTRALLAGVGVDLPLHVERHALAVVDVPGTARQILPFAWCDDPLLHYARPEGEDLILVGLWAGGGTAHRNLQAERPEPVTDLDHYRQDADQDECARILAHMLPRVPALQHYGLRRGYAGLYDMSPDDLPVIGPVPGIDNLYVIAGSSGHGFKLGPAVGEEVARLIVEGAALLLEPFRPERLLNA